MNKPQGPMDTFLNKNSSQQILSALNAHKVDRKFVNLHGVSKHLFCTICQEVFDDAKRTSCGHTFCHGCIQEWINKNSRCPICRHPGSINDLSKDLIATNIIGDLEVTCVYKGIFTKK